MVDWASLPSNVTSGTPPYLVLCTLCNVYVYQYNLVRLPFINLTNDVCYAINMYV